MKFSGSVAWMGDTRIITLEKLPERENGRKIQHIFLRKWVARL
jgi:hypothetical protein